VRAEAVCVKKAVLACFVVLASLAAPAQADDVTAVTDPATGITPNSAIVRGHLNLNGQASYYFEIGTTTAYGTQSAVATASGTSTVQKVAAKVVGATPSTTYHYRLVAASGGNTVFGADQTFATKPPDTDPTSGGGGSGTQPTSGDDPTTGGTDDPAGTTTTTTTTTTETAPVLGKTIGAAPASGSIRVQVPGSNAFVPLATGAPIPSGSTVDARHGTVNIVTALGSGAATQAAQFRGAVFKVRQSKSSGGMTDLYLRGGSFSGCASATPGHARVAAARKRVVRSLWGRDHHGRFRTHGRHAVATVRGTEWTMTDSCSGTLTKVAAGAVAVRDNALHKTVVVKAGHSYLARAAH
jgi:hypothetical protein